MAVKQVMYRGRLRWRARRTFVSPEDGKEKQMIRYRDAKWEAEEADVELEKEIEKVLIEHGASPRRRTPTVAEFWEEVMVFARKRQLDKSTLANKRRAWKRFGPGIAGVPIDQLRGKRLDDLRARIIRDCRSIGTARITVDEVRAMLRLAHRWEYIDKVPDIPRVSATAAQTQHDPLPKALEPAQAVALLRELSQLDNPIHHALATVQLWTGCRVGMAMGLTEQDVDSDLGMVRFRQQWNDDERAVGPVKGRVTVKLPLLPELEVFLREYVREVPGAELIFATAGTGMPIRRCSYNKQLKLAAQRLEIPMKVTSHTLRHTVGTIIGLTTGSPLAVKSFLAHADARVSSAYIHAESQHALKAARALQEVLTGARTVGTEADLPPDVSEAVLAHV